MNSELLPARMCPVLPWRLKRRRNSRLQIGRHDDRLQVCKSYHRVYTAQQERDAYRSLESLCARVENIRTPHIYGVDEANNAIYLEFIEGVDLKRAITASGLAALGPHEDRLLRLFAQARLDSIHFDSDPANFLVEEASGDLVMVDPVCQQVELQDFVFVVFLFGLVKAGVAAPHRVYPHRMVRKLRVLCDQYCQHVPGVTPVGLRRQLAEYVSVVIRWNQESAEDESLGLSFVRRSVWVPALRLLALWLSR